MTEDEFQFQIAVWGYADSFTTWETAAKISETRGDAGWIDARLWDHPEWLENATLNGEPVPERFALPAVTEYLAQT